MDFYSIGDFSNMTGLPQSKIRFYEKLGLFAAKRLENGYRVFTPEDAFRANAFRSLLLYGFTVEQAIDLLDQKQNSEQFAGTLADKRAELERQKQLLDYRLHALDRSLHFIQHPPRENDFRICDREDLLYVLSSDGWDFSVSGRNSAAIARFTGLFGISRFTRVVSLASLLSEGEIRPSYACSIPAGEEWRLEGCPPEQVHRLSMGKCLMFHRTLTREQSLRRETFNPMQTWLADHGYRIRSDFVIHPTFLNLDGNGTDIETVIVPVS